jgi:hypothetical protein
MTWRIFRHIKSSGRFLRDVMQIEILSCNIDYVSRLVRRGRFSLILLRLTTMLDKLQVLQNTINLARSKIRIKHGHTAEVRRARKEVFPT